MRPLRALVIAGAGMAAAGAAAAWANSRSLPVVQTAPAVKDGPDARGDRVAVLLPVRDEELNVESVIPTLLAQPAADEILVLDDASGDRTAEVAGDLLKPDPRARLLSGTEEPPPGWLGKTWACHRLSEATTADVLVFVDADVTLAPGAVTGAVQTLRALDLAMLSPYPRQQTTSALTRLVQPLLQWSWLTFIPQRTSLRRQPPSMAVGNGQFAVFDAAAYRRIGGHSAVAGEVVEDVALARALREAGFRTAVADGHHLAVCRMYESNSELVDGYAKSLWQAFGSEPGAVVTMAFLAVVYVLPPAAMLLAPSARTRGWGGLGYAAAVAGRVVVARRTGQHIWPDAFAHPLSIASLIGLTAVSLRRHRRRTLTWKSRPV